MDYYYLVEKYAEKLYMVAENLNHIFFLTKEKYRGVSMALTILDISYKLYHAICDALHLASFTQCFSRFAYVVAYISMTFLFMLK